MVHTANSVEPIQRSCVRAWTVRVLTLVLLALVMASGCHSPTVGTTSEDEIRSLADPLPSWNESSAKRAIVAFIDRVTTIGSPDFVPADERIATFDNDGTLWSEQPMYVQAAFVNDRIKTLAPSHPEWKDTQPFKGVLEGDVKAVAKTGERGIVELLAATSSGMTTDAFDRTVSDWITTARHPTYDRPYTEMVFVPMVELLRYLEASGFKTFIVSGGGADFMRVWTERVYGIPRERVIGSRGKVSYEISDGRPTLMRDKAIDFVDDGPGKPVGIHQAIGRRPIAAFGNSDGDFEMLDWTTSAPGARFGLIVHHTDGQREVAYDRTSEVGRLARALDAAPEHGWVVVDMKEDWKVVFPFGRW